MKRKAPEPKIVFTPHDRTIGDSNGPLYITVEIMANPVDGTLIDPNYMTNVATKEFLFSHQLMQGSYDPSNMMIKTHKGTFVKPLGKISLLVTVFEKHIEQWFDVTLTFDTFEIKLGIPWLKAMKAIPSTIYKCVKFHLNRQVHVIPRNTYKPLSTQQHFTFDYFCNKTNTKPELQTNFTFLSYRNYKAKLLHPVPSPSIQEMTKDKQPECEENFRPKGKGPYAKVPPLKSVQELGGHCQQQNIPPQQMRFNLGASSSLQNTEKTVSA